MKSVFIFAALIMSIGLFAAEVPTAKLIEPAALAKTLNGAARPLLLQVGSHVLYAQAHIPGSEYIGAAGQDAGIKALRERLTKEDRARDIVIYCGCCAWKKCPNIRPASALLTEMGFTNFKVLNIPSNLGEDWVKKGYPVAKGR